MASTQVTAFTPSLTAKLGEGGKEMSRWATYRSEVDEPCQQVRLSKDRLQIRPLPQKKSWVRGKGSKLGGGSSKSREPSQQFRLS